MSKTGNTIVLILITLLLSALVIGCSDNTVVNHELQNDISTSDSSSDLTNGQVEILRMSGGDSGYPTPWLRGRKGGGNRTINLIYDSLLEKDDKSIIPWLAKEYEILDGGKQYLFTLRDNVIWHDGTPFSAEDVKFTFDYTKDFPMVESPISSTDIENVEVIEPNQVLITVTEIGAPLLERIGKVRIVPKHIWENVDDPNEYEAENATVGTGPYMLADYNKSAGTYKYEAFSEFWGPTPGAKILIRFPVSDGVLALEAGEIDIVRHVPNDLLEKFEADPDYKVVVGPALSGSRLLFNLNGNSLLNEKSLRQAIAYAIDTYELIEKLGRGIGEPSNSGILPPAHNMYNPNVRQYDCDLIKCQELFSVLGYTEQDQSGFVINEKGERISLNLLIGEDSIRSAELVKEQLQRAGIELNIYSMDGSAQETQVREGEFELAIVGHAGLGDDPDYLRERFCVDEEMGRASAQMATIGYYNEYLFTLLSEQRMIMDFEERKNMLYEIQEILAEEVLEIPLYFGYDYTVYRPANYDEWIHEYDARNFTDAKLSYVLYSQWNEKQ